MGITDILITAVVGLLVVFSVLVILMLCIKVMAFVFAKVNKENNTSDGATSPASAAEKKDLAPAPGSCGDLILKDVSDRDAALIMAIVADELQTPLNRLKFISIKKAED